MYDIKKTRVRLTAKELRLMLEQIPDDSVVVIEDERRGDLVFADKAQVFDSAVVLTGFRMREVPTEAQGYFKGPSVLEFSAWEEHRAEKRRELERGEYKEGGPRRRA